MAKVALTAALLVALVVLAVTTTTDAQGRSRRCINEARIRRFESCRRYIQETRNSNQRSASLEECCGQLGSMSSDCRCGVIGDALRQISGGNQGQFRDRAQNIPIRCNFRQAERCQSLN